MELRPPARRTDRKGARLLVIPEWRKSRPPRAALAWVLAAIGPGSRLRSVRRLGGGGWAATHAVDVDDRQGVRRRLVLRRWARPGWEEDPEFTAAREAAVLECLASSGLPTPRVVAVDPEGDACGVPALLMTRLPGRPPSRAASRRPAVLSVLVERLAEINTLDLGLDAVAATFAPYYELDGLEAPPETRRPELWTEAFTVARTPPPGPKDRFMHRDYHQGNTLWLGGELTGIVDWTSASFGPPAADLAHLLANLGIDHGPEIADAARDAHASLAGAWPDQWYWDIRMLLDGGPDFGESLRGGQGLARLERYLASLLARVPR